MNIIAHRGLHQIYQENTMDAFLEASNEEIDGIEFDVRITKDKEFVIIHNALINKTSNGSGFVKDKTLKELRKYNFGTLEYPSKISTLKEVLEINFQNKILLIELKAEKSFEEKTINKLLNLILKYRYQNLYLVSFNRSLIDLIHKKEPTIKVGLCITNVINRSFLNKDYDFQLVHYSLAKEVNVSMETFFWTVNKKEIKEELLKIIPVSKLNLVTDTPYEMI